MLHALREISEPGPSSSTPIPTSAEVPLAPPISRNTTQPPAGDSIQLDISESGALRQRGVHSSGVSSEWSEGKFEAQSEETTEDEMDEDVVLLKKPKENVA